MCVYACPYVYVAVIVGMYVFVRSLVVISTEMSIFYIKKATALKIVIRAVPINSQLKLFRSYRERFTCAYFHRNKIEKQKQAVFSFTYYTTYISVLLRE